EQDRVGALLFSDQVEHVVRHGKGRRHALRLIRDLLAFASERRGTNLVQAIHYASNVLGHRSVVVILSDFLAEGWEKALRELAARHEVIAITVDDPRELEPPAAGWIEMEDAENGRRALVNTGSGAAIRRWRGAAEARRTPRADRAPHRAGAPRCGATSGPTGCEAPGCSRSRSTWRETTAWCCAAPSGPGGASAEASG